MARRTKEEAAETRQQLLETALDVFSRKGYSHTTFVDIAKPLGLSKGAVYWHFKSKTDLLVALIEESIVYKRDHLNDPAEKGLSLEGLRRCYVNSARLVLEDPQMRRFEFFINFQIEWSEELLADVRSGMAKIGEDPFRKYSIAILKLQEAGVVDHTRDAENLGSILIGSWMGLMRMLMIGFITKEELICRLEYSFDSLFKDIVNKECEG